MSIGIAPDTLQEAQYPMDGLRYLAWIPRRRRPPG